MSTFSDETSLEGGTTRKLLSLRHTHGSAPRSPYLPCQITSYGSKGKFGATAELRNILQEKMRDKGSSSSRCDRRFGKKKQHRCLLTQSLSPTRIHVSPNQTCLPHNVYVAICNKTVNIQSCSTNPRFPTTFNVVTHGDNVFSHPFPHTSAFFFPILKLT